MRLWHLALVVILHKWFSKLLNEHLRASLRCFSDCWIRRFLFSERILDEVSYLWFVFGFLLFIWGLIEVNLGLDGSWVVGDLLVVGIGCSLMLLQLFILKLVMLQLARLPLLWLLYEVEIIIILALLLLLLLTIIFILLFIIKYSLIVFTTRNVFSF